MSFFNNVKSFFYTTEQDVLAFVVKVWNEEKVLAGEILGVFKWIKNTGLPALNSEIEAVLPILNMIGDATGHPELGPQIATLNSAVAQINHFATLSNSQTLTADEVTAGVGALMAATSAVKAVAGTAVAIVAKTPASAPAS
jgi:hypothetical protein